MAKKVIGVILDLEYPDSSIAEEGATTSMLSEVISIIESGAAENGFSVIYVSAQGYGADAIFDLVEQ